MFDRFCQNAFAVEGWTIVLHAQLVDEFKRYLQGTVAQAQRRLDETQPLAPRLDFETFLEVRRVSNGTLPCLVFMGFGMSLPLELVYHPKVARLRELVNQMTFLDNVSVI